MRNKNSYTFIAGRPFCDTLLNFAWVFFVIGTAISLLAYLSIPLEYAFYTLLFGLNMIGAAATLFWASNEFAQLDLEKDRTTLRAM